MAPDLPIIAKTYDLINWYIPLLNKLPRDHKFGLGHRMVQELYGLLEGLIQARYASQKLLQLQSLNTQLEILRYQTRLLHDFQLMPSQRYEYVSRQLNDIGGELGGWIKQQQQKQQDA